MLFQEVSVRLESPRGRREQGKARLKQCLPEALKVASAHRFLWRHARPHASICSRSDGFLRRNVEDLEAVRWLSSYLYHAARG
jgi:hypothetical protein